MNKATKLKYYIESLCIYDLKSDEVISSLLDLLMNLESEAILSKQSIFFNKVSSHKSLKLYISRLVLTHDNVFTMAASANGARDLSPAVISGVKSDLMKLEAIASVTASDILSAVKNEDIKEILSTMPEWETGEAAPPLKNGWDSQLDTLIEFHQRHGYGLFAKYIAFAWRNHSLFPISATDPITINDLKNYELQRQKVIDNTESFVKGYPSNNVLLYGDRARPAKAQQFMPFLMNMRLRALE